MSNNTSDIVERLRALSMQLVSQDPADRTTTARMVNAASQEIERLRALLRKVHDTGEVTGRTVCEVPRDIMTEVYEAMNRDLMRQKIENDPDLETEAR